MALLQQPLGTRDQRSHVFRNFDLGTCQAFERDNLLASLKPPLYYFPLTAGRDTRHLFDLCGRVPLLLHRVQGAEPQPDDAPLFVNGLVHPPYDDGVGLRCLQKGIASRCILSWRLRHLEVLALAEVHDLGVDVLLSPCGLGLGQRGIVWLVFEGGDLSAFSLPGIDHDC